MTLTEGFLVVTRSRGILRGIFISMEGNNTEEYALPQNEKEAYKKIIADAADAGCEVVIGETIHHIVSKKT